MSKEEAVGYIISQWKMECPVSRIMVSLICLGKPITKASVLAVIKRYCDSQSENASYSSGNVWKKRR
jgi:hypothetical protein